MKTKTQNQTKEKQKSGLSNRPEQVSTGSLPEINLNRRRENRVLNTETLLSLLAQEAPNFFAVAEVVGKWVWIQFQEKQPKEVTSALSEFGFHWNNTRQSWQHPCGTFRDERASYDPRKRYGSYFAANRQAA